MAIRSNRQLLPFQQYDEQDVVNLYATNFTGLAGTPVKVTTWNPSTGTYFTTTQVGANFAGITSNRWQNTSVVSKCASGDGRWNGFLGVTLMNCAEFDENGQPLKLIPQRAWEEWAVLSGQTMPVATRGVFGIATPLFTAANNAPAPGSLATISVGSTAGIFDVVTKSQISSTGNPNQSPPGYTQDQIVGQWLSVSGIERAGYAYLRLGAF